MKSGVLTVESLQTCDLYWLTFCKRQMSIGVHTARGHAVQGSTAHSKTACAYPCPRSTEGLLLNPACADAREHHAKELQVSVKSACEADNVYCMLANPSAVRLFSMQLVWP